MILRKRTRSPKKYIIVSLLLVVVIVTLIKLNAVSALLLFLLVGVLPGTAYVVPSNVMSLLFTTAICLVLFWPFILMVLRMILVTRLVDTQQTPVRRLVKRRAN